MIKRHYSKFRKPDGREAWAVTVEMEGGEVLSSFLYSDANAFGDVLLERFRHVLAGGEEEELTGNACQVRIGPKETVVQSFLDEDDAAVKVDTRELAELVREWMEMTRRKDT